MEVYVVLPVEDRANFLACCDMDDVQVYESIEAAEYAAYKLNQKTGNNVRFSWKACEFPVFKGDAA